MHPASFTTTTGGDLLIDHTLASDLLNLTSQQRNLLLLRPLFTLEATKHVHLSPETKEPLMAGLDTNYLALFALDSMMEGTLVAAGITSEELRHKLAKAIEAMQPNLIVSDRLRAAEVVVRALANASEGYKAFSFSYFDAVNKTTKNFQFQLVRYEPDDDGQYLYRPTAEGYLVYLGMLDLTPEDSQEAMDKMLQVLVSRGKFGTALEVARRALTLSIEYRQAIKDRLALACRAPGAVSWVGDLRDYLARARDHVKQRQLEDVRMLESVRHNLSLSSESASRRELQVLHDTLERSSRIRTTLVTEISAAGPKFLEAQSRLFSARKPYGLPDLAPDLMDTIVKKNVGGLADRLDGFLAAVYPPTAPKLYDLGLLWPLLSEQRAPPSDAVMSVEGTLKPLEQVQPQFSKELVDEVNLWLATKFEADRTYQLDDLLVLAEDAGLSRTHRRCLVLELFRIYSGTESNFKNMQVHALPVFTSDVVCGDNLLFSKK